MEEPLQITDAQTRLFCIFKQGNSVAAPWTLLRYRISNPFCIKIIIGSIYRGEASLLIVISRVR